jgi:hypothetical protein
MNRNKNILDEVAEDGHPSEAALEFRKQAIRLGIVKEVSADAVDLAISWAWLGKAISRTKASVRWGLEGIDANTFEFIVALGKCHSLRRTALMDATSAEAMSGRREELLKIRKLAGFLNAVNQAQKVATVSIRQVDVLRLSELAYITGRMPGTDVTKMQTVEISNILAFPGGIKGKKSTKKDGRQA